MNSLLLNSTYRPPFADAADKLVLFFALEIFTVLIEGFAILIISRFFFDKGLTVGTSMTISFLANLVSVLLAVPMWLLLGVGGI